MYHTWEHITGKISGHILVWILVPVCGWLASYLEMSGWFYMGSQLATYHLPPVGILPGILYLAKSCRSVWLWLCGPTIRVVSYGGGRSWLWLCGLTIRVVSYGGGRSWLWLCGLTIGIVSCGVGLLTLKYKADVWMNFSSHRSPWLHLPFLLRLMEGLGAHWSVNEDRAMATKYVRSFSLILLATLWYMQKKI